MGARVGIFDADVYGPSLPTMVSPENRLLEMVIANAFELVYFPVFFFEWVIILFDCLDGRDKDHNSN